ncbi:hypothetical protein BDW67DRAFT_187657 [Aspergillus spinulosporus]
MDGFALSSAATETARPETPVNLEVIATTAAGDRPYAAADSLRNAKMASRPAVPIEVVVVQEDRCPPLQRWYVSVCKPARRWQRRQFAEGGFTQGDRIVDTGDCIQPQYIMAMASVI